MVGAVSIESGLEGRNNVNEQPAPLNGLFDVSIESGLEGRNNTFTLAKLTLSILSQ